MEFNVELRDVQRTILYIFKEIIRVCNENDISYFIIGGTALGAVRHGGFIPWDDDLDIGMTRKNYNKFLSIAKDKLPDELFLQTVETETESPFYFAKVRKNKTKFVECYCKKLKIHHGVYVDIFPYDNIPDDPKLRKQHNNIVSFWSNLFIAKCVTGSSVPQKGIKGKFKLFLRMVAHIILIPISKKFLFKKLDLATQKYNDIPCTMKSYVKYPYLMIPSSDLDDLETIEFEGFNVKCPKNIKKYLKNHFGDFMTLPKENQRIGHRPYKLEL